MALIKDRADAAAREKAAAMPPPVSTARRGITACRYIGLTDREAALAVIRAADGAAGIMYAAGCVDVSWLDAIRAEAARVYVSAVQKALPGGTPWDSRGNLRNLECPECGILWCEPSPQCPRIAYNLHRLPDADGA